MKKLSILHLASFNGNIGDLANHSGFYKKFKQNVYENFEITQLEIRNFYKLWGKMKFDEGFVELVNKHDLLVIGGGNFFEICWDYSSTGTTIDISKKILDRIKTPILFNGIGVDDVKGTNNSNIKKFSAFINNLVESNRTFITVRNDGSRDILSKYIDREIVENNILTVPDGGFFLELPPLRMVSSINDSKKYIGINLAGDMLDLRFNSENLSYPEFKLAFAKFLNNLLQRYPDYDIIFFPHIHTDYATIIDILSLMRDDFIRTRINIGPYFQESPHQIFHLYNKCKIILEMRFHSNVCAIGLGVPTVGLITYPKHGEMYREISLENRIIHANIKGFEKRLTSELDNFILDVNYRREVQNMYNEVLFKLNKQIDEVHKHISKWLFDKIIS